MPTTLERERQMFCHTHKTIATLADSDHWGMAMANIKWHELQHDSPKIFQQAQSLRHEGGHVKDMQKQKNGTLHYAKSSIIRRIKW